MAFRVSDLWRAPALNPVNKKARSVPVLNVVDPHGRVFFFSWMGFMIAFWAWYTFPPLVRLFFFSSSFGVGKGISLPRCVYRSFE